MMKYAAQFLQMRVLVNGRAVQEYHQQDRTFVEGRAGSRFELELRNLAYQRLLVHPMVDGLSCMTGQPADRRDSQHGYVLGPRESLVVPGWRLDDQQVAQFFFAGRGGSYAESKGQPENRGVIACPVWEEQPWVARWYTESRLDFTVPPCPPYPRWPQPDGQFPSYPTVTAPPQVGAAQVFCSVQQEQPTSGQFNLGTGFGERRDHRVASTPFTPATQEPLLTALIYYTDEPGLRARGIDVQRARRRKEQGGLPDPFPGSGCRPPAGWRG